MLAIWVFASGGRLEPATVETAGLITHAGPWGRISLHRIVISPPAEFVPQTWRLADAAWNFPGVTPEQVRSLLSTLGVDAGTVARLMAAARPAPNGLTINPPRDAVRALSPQARSGLYRRLAAVPSNVLQASSFRFPAESPAEWFDGSAISPELRAAIEPLVYKEGGYLHFADLDIAIEEARQRNEVRALMKTLLRQATVLMRVHVDSEDSVDDLADYWGRGGRRTDLRPMLESIAQSGEPVDVIHLLPTLAREHLYRYPKVTPGDLDKPSLANCFWTSLNFFESAPDERYLDIKHALQALKRDYFFVESDFELGDVVTFADDRGDIFHVAVYLADDLLLTKNGWSAMSPWIIQPLEQVKGFYRTYAPDPDVKFHRRNDF